MNETINTFIYQPNLILEILLIIAILVSMVKPQFLTALATVILMVRPNERMDLDIPFIKIMIPALLLVIMFNFSMLRAKRPHVGLKYLAYFIGLIFIQSQLFYQEDFTFAYIPIGVGLLLFVAVIMFMNDDFGVKLFSYAIILSCFLICFEPIYYHFTESQGSVLWNLFHSYHENRLQAWGMWANANETAFIACIGVANLLFLVLKHQRNVYYVASATMIPFFIFVVYLTASRAGFASLLLVFLPIVVLIKHMSVRLVTICVFVASIAFSSTFTPERTDAKSSSESRSELRSIGFRLITENPLRGVGFGMGRYEAGSNALHNTYIQAFAETGVIGGVLLLSYLYYLGKYLYVSFKSRSKLDGHNHLVLVLGIYCSSIFYLFWGNQLLTILFFLVCSQITNAILNSENQSALLLETDELKICEEVRCHTNPA